MIIKRANRFNPRNWRIKDVFSGIFIFNFFGVVVLLLFGKLNLFPLCSLPFSVGGILFYIFMSRFENFEGDIKEEPKIYETRTIEKHGVQFEAEVSIESIFYIFYQGDWRKIKSPYKASKKQVVKTTKKIKR